MNPYITRMLAIVLLTIGTSAMAGKSAPPPSNEFPADVATALRQAKTVEIYSLEPWTSADEESVDFLYRYEVLGKATLSAPNSRTAIAAFEAAISNWGQSLSACFDPRHAIRIEADGYRFDLLLCFDCNQMALFRDEKRITTLGAGGSPKVLNDLMTQAGLELSKTGFRKPTDDELAKKAKDTARWLAGMPSKVRTLWQKDQQYQYTIELSNEGREALRKAVQAEYPDRPRQIRALLRWFGSGEGTWSGFPGYEVIPEQLLLDYSTSELLSVVDPAKLNAAEMEGSARLLSRYNFRPEGKDHQPIADAVKQALLRHVETTGDPKDYHRRDRARRAFLKE